MANKMVFVSDERAKIDETELLFYGLCSTQIYVDYREKIDHKLKYMMLELAKYYDEEYSNLDKDYVNNMFFEQYKAFWAMAEPSLKEFYEEIQAVLALPPDCGAPDDISPKDVFCSRDTQELETKISELQEKFKGETYFLHELKQMQNIIETTCQPLKNRLSSAIKIHKSSMKSSKGLESLDVKRTKMMEKYEEHFDGKALVNFIASDLQTDVKNYEEMLEEFARIRLKQNQYREPL